MHTVDSSIQLYCEVDAIHPDSKGHTGYTIGLHPNGTFYNRSAKQTLVSTSSTHAEMRALYTLLKDILFIIYICSEVNMFISGILGMVARLSGWQQVKAAIYVWFLGAVPDLT